MLGTADVDEKTGKEPLLADETVPSEFLPSSSYDGPKDKRVGRVLGALIALVTVGAVALGASSQAPDWHPLLAPYVEFVEQERGLNFIEPVTLVETNIVDYVPANVRRFASGRRDPQLDQAYRLLGVVNFDPGEPALNGPLEDRRFLRTTEAITDSHYRLDTQQILLRRDLPEVAIQLTIVHELTRALQHQHGLVTDDFGDIPPFSAFDESDGRRLFDALVEGDANRVERAYYDQLPPEEQQAYHDSSGDLLSGVRNPAIESDRFTIGAPFTSWVAQRDGTEVLNEMLRLREHGSTDLFVDVLGDFQQTHNAVAEANLPVSDRPPLDGFGAFGWFITLAPHLGTADAFDAVIGYDNDAFIVLDNPNVQRTSPMRTCIHSEVFFDSADHATEFAALVTPLGFETEVRPDQPSVRADLCHQLSEVAEQSPSPVVPLIVANELAAHHLANEVPVDVARCASITQAKTVPHDLNLDDFAGYDSYIENSQAFVDSCL